MSKATKLKRLEKQAERDKKLFDDIISGKVRIAINYDKRKKRAQPNKVATTGDTEADIQAAQEMLEKTAHVYRMLLPGLVQTLGEIEDPRKTRNQKHDFAVLLLHAIIMFAFHIESRRQANKLLPGMNILGILQAVFPEMKTMPHADTVARVLEGVDSNSIQEAYIQMFKKHVCNPGFRDKYTNGKFVVLIDGSQSFSRNYCWDNHALCRHVGEQKKEQYYVAFLESVLILNNGAVLPVYTETIENDGEMDGDSKQDCELKAFYRMSEKIYKIFGKGCITLVIDGLYACGKVISICNSYNWGFMISLKDGNMPGVWEDAEGLMKAEPESQYETGWGSRIQVYRWANGIEYTYGNNHTKLKLNVVVCHEQWIEQHPRSTKKTVKEFKRYAWLSSELITVKNVFHICTEIARRRWWVESNFNTEKNQGYAFKHCFSYNWNAMKAFHYLMKIARFFNNMLAYSEFLAPVTQEKGIRGFISSLRDAFKSAGMNASKIRAAATIRNNRWRMTAENIFLI